MHTNPYITERLPFHELRNIGGELGSLDGYK